MKNFLTLVALVVSFIGALAAAPAFAQQSSPAARVVRPAASVRWKACNKPPQASLDWRQLRSARRQTPPRLTPKRLPSAAPVRAAKPPRPAADSTACGSALTR
jgi:hypothetical protein